MSENLLLHRRPAPQQRAVPSFVARPLRAAPARPDVTARPLPITPARPDFAARNSPVDLLFRALWQLVGVYVYLVLVVKDRKLPH